MTIKKSYPSDTLAYQIAKVSSYFINSRDAAKSIVKGQISLMTELHGSVKEEIYDPMYQPKTGEIFAHWVGFFGETSQQNWYEMTDAGMKKR